MQVHDKLTFGIASVTLSFKEISFGGSQTPKRSRTCSQLTKFGERREGSTEKKKKKKAATQRKDCWLVGEVDQQTDNKGRISIIVGQY